jgi:hypothetical protein
MASKRLQLLQTFRCSQILYLNTGHRVIVKRGERLCVLPAEITGVSGIRHTQCGLCLFCAMFSDKVYQKIRLCERALEFTTRHVTFHEFFILFAVLCAIVQFQGGCMKKPFFAEETLIRKTGLMRLHMIVHRVLVFLSNIAMRTHIESICVFCVDVGHASDVGGGADGFNFFGGVRGLKVFTEDSADGYYTYAVHWPRFL